MDAVIVDNRKKPLATERVVCSRCGFPRIELTVESTGRAYKSFAYASGPLTEELAVALGWSETEHGLICPLCTGQNDYQAVIDYDEGAESHTGMGGLASGIALGTEDSPNRIQDEEIVVPTVHNLESKHEAGPVEGKAVVYCTRCHQEWLVEMSKEGDSWVCATGEEYDENCIPISSTKG